MNNETNFDKFGDYISKLNERIKEKGQLNLHDTAVLAENFYKELLNNLYDWQLVNANSIKQNHEAIDLIDKNNKIIVQVTAKNTPGKIRDTLEKIKKLEYKGYKLYFAFVGKQVQSRKNDNYDKLTPKDIIFIPKEQIIQTKELKNNFYDSKISVQNDVLDIVKQYLGNKEDEDKQELENFIREIQTDFDHFRHLFSSLVYENPERVSKGVTKFREILSVCRKEYKNSDIQLLLSELKEGYNKFQDDYDILDKNSDQKYVEKVNSELIKLRTNVASSVKKFNKNMEISGYNYRIDVDKVIESILDETSFP